MFKSHPPHPVPVSAIAAVDSEHRVNSWKTDCSDHPLSSGALGGPRVRAAEDGGLLGIAHPETESPADWLFTHTQGPALLDLTLSSGKIKIQISSPYCGHSDDAGDTAHQQIMKPA